MRQTLHSGAVSGVSGSARTGVRIQDIVQHLTQHRSHGAVRRLIASHSYHHDHDNTKMVQHLSFIQVQHPIVDTLNAGSFFLTGDYVHVGPSTYLADMMDGDGDPRAPATRQITRALPEGSRLLVSGQCLAYAVLLDP